MPRLVRVVSVHEIPGDRGRTVEVGGAELAVFRGKDDRYYATSPSCPHEGGPLGDGVLDGQTVLCPWHAFDFDLRTGACRVDPELSIAVYPVRVHGCDLLVELP